MTEAVRFNFRMSKDERDNLDDMASLCGCTVNELLRRFARHKLIPAALFRQEPDDIAKPHN